jgi:hypothetical protein
MIEILTYAFKNEKGLVKRAAKVHVFLEPTNVFRKKINICDSYKDLNN